MHEDNDAEPRLAFAATPPPDPHGAVLAAAPVPLHCNLYRAGHSVHPIQAKLACCEGSALPVEGDVVGIAEGVVVVTTPHGRLRLRNHETALLRRVLDGSAGRVLVRDRSILGVRGGDNEYLFSVAAADDEWTECAPRRAIGCEIAPLRRADAEGSAGG